ncbi:MAG TPA: hypothetical protein EYM41_00325 [Dehalococcoidia bacterium]|nr:hypothetical protein [Dehalococcoidia bacterium]
MIEKSRAARKSAPPPTAIAAICAERDGRRAAEASGAAGSSASGLGTVGVMVLFRRPKAAA